MNKTILDPPRFDWMQATVERSPWFLTETLAGTLGGEFELARGMHGYDASYIIKRDDETLCRVLHGNNGNPHVMVSGAVTDEVVPVLRTGFSGEHQVTRLDSAQDFDQVGGYDSLRSVLLDVAGSAGLTHMKQESTTNGVLSRTTYVGSPKSRVRVRLYEKGQMERQRGDAAASEGWVRLEAQIRPTGAKARVRASELDPTEAWGLSAWTRDLARLAFGADVQRVSMQEKREPDFARAFRFMARQYGATLETAIEHFGSLEAAYAELCALRDPEQETAPAYSD